jgi:hypothetical protein
MAKNPPPSAVMFTLIMRRWVSHLRRRETRTCGPSQARPAHRRRVGDGGRRSGTGTLPCASRVGERRHLRGEQRQAIQVDPLAVTLQKAVPGSMARRRPNVRRGISGGFPGRNYSTESKQARYHFSRPTESPSSSISRCTPKTSRPSVRR